MKVLQFTWNNDDFLQQCIFASLVFYVLTHLPLDKWLPFHRWHFEMHFCEWKVLCFDAISLRFVPKLPIDNKSALVQVMAWRRTSDKPLPEPMSSQFTDAYKWHWGRWVNVWWKIKWIYWDIYTPHFNKVERGIYWYHLVRPSICPSVRLSVCPSVDKIVSTLYLQQYSSDPFHICTSYQATKEGVSRVMPVSKLKNLKFWQIF